MSKTVIEIGKIYRGLINKRCFKVVGLSKLSSWDIKRNNDIYYDIEVIDPKPGEIERMSRSKSYLEHLLIEEVKQ